MFLEKLHSCRDSPSEWGSNSFKEQQNRIKELESMLQQFHKSKQSVDIRAKECNCRHELEALLHEDEVYWRQQGINGSKGVIRTLLFSSPQPVHGGGSTLFIS
ncbi:hypothetical protein Salat_2550200 [Sesamum alatum]|uniref:Uncharacterized protein n=1 Tax=Sesamum alatum TaxID=300844 RepID=A0AAE2CCN8_9LAMI|nr:hypothetical protein Salat_2550200 [Sesamum alatum]